MDKKYFIKNNPKIIYSSYRCLVHGIVFGEVTQHVNKLVNKRLQICPLGFSQTTCYVLKIDIESTLESCNLCNRILYRALKCTPPICPECQICPNCKGVHRVPYIDRCLYCNISSDFLPKTQIRRQRRIIAIKKQITEKNLFPESIEDLIVRYLIFIS